MQRARTRVGSLVNQRQDYSALVEQLLSDLNLIQIAPGTWRSSCPLPHSEQSKSVHHFSVREYGKWWNCFSCGESGHIQKLVERVFHLTWQQAAEYVESSPGRKVDPLALIPRRGPLVDKKEPLKEAQIAAYKLLCPQSLLVRGFSQDILRKYEIGYDNVSSKAVFPIRGLDGKIAGLTYRVDYGWIPEKAKYWHDGFTKSEYLYGAWQVQRDYGKRKKLDTLWLVEGQLDPVRLAQLGTPAVAVMGSSISGPQLEIVRALCPGRVVVGLDSDAAGERGAAKTVRLSLRRGFGPGLVVAKLPEGKKDPGELTSLRGIEYIPWEKWLLLYRTKLARAGITA